MSSVTLETVSLGSKHSDSRLNKLDQEPGNLACLASRRGNTRLTFPSSRAVRGRAKAWQPKKELSHSFSIGETRNSEKHRKWVS